VTIIEREYVQEEFSLEGVTIMKEYTGRRSSILGVQ